MKTTTLSRIIVLVVILFSGLSQSGLNAQESGNFITNEEKTGDLVVSKVIYKLDGSLHRHMKYDFTYDGEQRMTSKTAFKWNDIHEAWEPHFKIDYAYSSNEIILNYARWNPKSKAYDDAVEKSVYELNEANMPVACTHYKGDDVRKPTLATIWAMYIQPRSAGVIDRLPIDR